MLGAKCILKRGPNYCGAKGVCDFSEGTENDCTINITLQKISRHSRLKSIGEAAIDKKDLREAKTRVIGLMDQRVTAEKEIVLRNLAKKLDHEIKRRS